MESGCPTCDGIWGGRGGAAVSQLLGAGDRQCVLAVCWPCAGSGAGGLAVICWHTAVDVVFGALGCARRALGDVTGTVRATFLFYIHQSMLQALQGELGFRHWAKKRGKKSRRATHCAAFFSKHRADQ